MTALLERIRGEEEERRPAVEVQAEELLHQTRGAVIPHQTPENTQESFSGRNKWTERIEIEFSDPKIDGSEEPVRQHIIKLQTSVAGKTTVVKLRRQTKEEEEDGGTLVLNQWVKWKIDGHGRVKIEGRNRKIRHNLIREKFFILRTLDSQQLNSFPEIKEMVQDILGLLPTIIPAAISVPAQAA